MARYAIIENGIVINVIEADDRVGKERGGVLTSEAGPGWTYDGKDFTPPDTPTPPPDPRGVARDALKNRADSTVVTIKMLKDTGLL